MSELVVLGTIGLDTISTPFGKVDDVLGGSSVYAAYAASFFSDSGIISVKGEDLDEKKLDFLKEKNVSLEGIKSEGKNFRWHGEYEFDMNEAKTLKTELNSLASFNPEVPEKYKKAKYVFLGNMDPEIQIKVIDEIESPSIILIDTMNFWIESKKDKLIEAIKKAHILVFNETEARQLFETANLIKAGKEALSLGLRAVIIKKGEHGALLFTKDEYFNCPSYPLENLLDPTGCGDVFGGTFLSYYAKTNDMRKAMVYGAVLASFNAEGFGIENLKKISMEDINNRFKEMESMRSF